jgi:endonuclease/exonuclease/phosphatase family metal-dependent hydrolase
MVWINMELEQGPVSLQNLDASWTMLIDLEDPTVDDLEYVFSPATRGGMGIGATRISPTGTRTTISPYDNQFHFAPTIAASRFELAIELEVPSRGTITLDRGGDHPPLLTAFSCTSHLDVEQPLAPWPAEAGTGEVRIVCWNVKFGGLLKQPDRAGRILRALDPDILLLQELEDEHTPQDVIALLNDQLGTKPARWNASASPVGGGLRSMVAARGGVRLPGVPDAVHRADEPDYVVRVAMLGVPMADQGTLLLGSAHLRCCGGPDSEEDMARTAEAMAIGNAIDDIVMEHAARARQLQEATGDHASPVTRRRNFIAGIVIGGDLNLVGSGDPLSILVTDRDPFGSPEDARDLEVLESMQPGGHTNATWSDPSKSFTPGRLDYIVYSGSTLAPVRSFILNTARIDPEALQLHGLNPEDAGRLSDHFPLVVDYSIR